MWGSASFDLVLNGSPKRGARPPWRWIRLAPSIRRISHRDSRDRNKIRLHVGNRDAAVRNHFGDTRGTPFHMLRNSARNRDEPVLQRAEKLPTNMAETPEIITDEQRKATFATWISTHKPEKPPRQTLITRVAPWRHEFIAAIAQGYSWDQLAKEIAPKPEIGINVTGAHLKRCVYRAFAAAKELVPGGRKERARKRRSKQS